MKLTLEQKKNYIHKGGTNCHFCGSDNISATEQVQVEGREAYCSVQCAECIKSWNEVYSLVDVYELE